MNGTICEESGLAVVSGEISITCTNNTGLCDDVISINPVWTVK